MGTCTLMPSLVEKLNSYPHYPQYIKFMYVETVDKIDKKELF